MALLSNTRSLDAAALDEAAREAGFVLIRTGNGWRLYEHPREIVAIRDPAQLADSLQGIEKHVSAGGEAAGFMRYEAGYAFEPLLFPLHPTHGTLLWFGLYEKS